MQCDVLYRAWRRCCLGAIRPQLDDYNTEESSGITPLRHVPIWEKGTCELYDLASYIAQSIAHGKALDLADYKMGQQVEDE